MPCAYRWNSAFGRRWKPVESGRAEVLLGARVLYRAGETDGQPAFGFVYGTLTNHAESGEELFEVFLDGQSGDVMYRIRAVSWPQSALTRVGQPIVRLRVNR